MLDCVLWADVARLSHPLFVACQRVPRNGNGLGGDAERGAGADAEPEPGCTINTVACSRMSVSAARPVQRQATYPESFLDCRFCPSLCPSQPHPPSHPVLAPLAIVASTAVAAAAAAVARVLARAFFMLQPGCSNNAQANEACIRQLHLAPAAARPLTAQLRLSASAFPTKPPQPFSYLCSDFQLCVVIYGTNEKRRERRQR